jgi:hypothetical protein
MKKTLIIVAMMAVMTIGLTVFALADTPNAAQTAMNTAFTSIASDITATITSVLPIALGILGLTLAIKFGIRWFKSLVGRS